MTDPYELIERGRQPLPTVDDEPTPRRGPGRPKGARNKRQRTDPDNRARLRQVGALLDEHTKMRLRLIGVALDRTVQDLIEEAINGIFTRYEKQARARIDDGGDRDVE